jgi:hypothetical protein
MAGRGVKWLIFVYRLAIPGAGDFLCHVKHAIAYHTAGYINPAYLFTTNIIYLETAEIVLINPLYPPILGEF